MLDFLPQRPALKPKRPFNLLQWLRAWGRAPVPPSSDRDRAEALIRAIDAGGIPLNPARVNAIARSLGLEVSVKAPVEHTIARIRAALQR